VTASNDQIAETIAGKAARPKRVRTDAGEAEQHSIRDQIEAQKFARQMSACESPFDCLRPVQAELPGGSG
jgi:hypothetical protein